MHSSKINFFIQSIHVTRTTFRVYIRTTAQTNRSIPFWAVFRRLSPWKSLNDESIYKTANVGVNVTRRTESLRSPNREKGGESFWLAWSGRAKEEEEEENKRRRDGCSGARVTRRVFSCTLLSRKGSREGDEVERRSVPATRNERRQWRRTGRRSGTRMRLEKRRDATPSSLSLSRCNSISPRFHSGRRSSPRENRSLLLSKFAKLGPSLPASLSNIFLHDDVPLPVELKKKKLPNYFPDRVNKRNVKSCAVIFLNRGTVAVSKENY